MAECECPMDGCDYTGSVESVEAHINGSTDEDHAGEFGADYRDELRSEIEERYNDPDRGAGALVAAPAAAGATVLGIGGDDGPPLAVIAVVGVLLLLAISSGGDGSQDAESGRESDVRESGGVVG